MSNKRIETIEDLRDELADVFQQLKSGDMPPKRAAEMNNAAGKMINTAKVQLEYAVLRKEAPSIKFLKGREV